MKNTLLLLSAIIFGVSLLCVQQTNAQDNDEARLLVFTKTEGFRHSSIPAGVEAIKGIAAENSFSVDHTEDSSVFNTDNLAQYDAVIFLSTTGNILNDTQQQAFESFISNGGGFVGIHAAADTEYEWPWYNKLVGAYFESHPQVQEATIEVLNRDHISTEHLPKEWSATDEWYNYKSIQPHINVLGNLDESSYQGGQNGENHPIIWYHETLGGRAFYTGRGHTNESFSEPAFREHILGGIQYVIGE